MNFLLSPSNLYWCSKDTRSMLKFYCVILIKWCIITLLVY